MSRITIQGRDWTSSSHAPGSYTHRLANMPLAKSAPPRVWRDAVLTGLLVAAVIVAAVLR